tara:strand:+ start:364 stop:1005 length:642 start_codon:yes stop_codon:yes gene_type:complete
MNEDLLRFKKKQKYLVFDFETCNLNLESLDNKPWQLGFITCQGTTILDKKDFYISWGDLNISKDAARITGFSKSKYNKGKKDASLVLKEFEKYLYDSNYLILGHNVLGFDVYIHNIYRRLLKKNADYSYVNRIIDTNCIARSIKNNIPFPSGSKLIDWQYKLLHHRTRGVKTNLKQLCKDYDIEFDESKLHEALYDVEKTFEVYKKMLWQVEI